MCPAAPADPVVPVGREDPEDLVVPVGREDPEDLVVPEDPAECRP